MLNFGTLDLLVFPLSFLLTSIGLKILIFRVKKKIKENQKSVENKRREFARNRRELQNLSAVTKGSDKIQSMETEVSRLASEEVKLSLTKTKNFSKLSLLRLMSFITSFTFLASLLYSIVVVLVSSMLWIGVSGTIVVLDNPNKTSTQKVEDAPKDKAPVGTITSIGTEATTVEERAIHLYKAFKVYEPNTTLNGAVGVIANFWHESQITAKRAEADYLNPPVGATDTSWDDDNWLNIDGIAIYGDNTLIKHRGLGLGQWTDTYDGAVRNTLLRDFAKSNGKEWYDLDLQLKFMFEGDNPHYIGVLKEVLTSNEDISSTTITFLNGWEGNPGNEVYSRLEEAQTVYNLLKNVN